MIICLENTFWGLVLSGSFVAVDLLLIVTPIVGFGYCSTCILLLCVHCSFAIILMGKRELVALLCLSSWCLVIMWLFLTMLQVCLQFVIVVFPDHTRLLFLDRFYCMFTCMYHFVCLCLHPRQQFSVMLERFPVFLGCISTKQRMDKASCPRTQHSASGESQTSDLLTSSLTLFHSVNKLLMHVQFISNIELICQ